MVRLWIRQDGEQPKALALVATKGPGPGRVVDVAARSADEARLICAAAQQDEPKEEDDPQGWLEWRRCKRLVSEVTRG